MSRRMAYWRCHYHLIWSTRERLPVLDEARADVVARCIKAISAEDQLKLHAVGMVDDHVHVAVSIPPRHSVASIVQHFKGSSSHQLGKLQSDTIDRWPGWQAEYGVLTFGQQSLDRIVAYVANQKSHHESNTLWNALERIRADVSP
jgi:putative transposase